MITALVLAAFFALLTGADLLPSLAERRCGLVCPPA